MTRETALRILGLEEQADEESIIGAYRRLVQSHHPDKNPDDTFIYKLNEAKSVLIGGSSKQGDKALSIVVTNALMAYREIERKEVEYKNEASLLLSEKVKPRRNRITHLRDMSVITTFLIAVLGFTFNSMNGFLDFSFENDNGAIQYSKDVLGKDSTIKSRNYDSLYVNDSIYKKKIDNYYSNTIKKYEKHTNSIYKIFGIFFLAFGGIMIAAMQTILKRYDTNLDEFKSHIDSRVKLKSLLLDVVVKNKLVESRISEEELKEFIRKYFLDSSSNESQFKSIIELAKRLQLDDIEKIIMLKFLEKKLIEERDFYKQSIVYEITT